ncbi:MAG: T9SS type A sorting domain-containing protein [Bacteroidota bacterium]
MKKIITLAIFAVFSGLFAKAQDVSIVHPSQGSQIERGAELFAVINKSQKNKSMRILASDWKWDTICTYTTLGVYQRFTQTIDANGNIATRLVEQKDNSNWMNFEKSVYTYDAYGKLLSKNRERWLNNTWSNSEKLSFTYDANGNKLTEKYERWQNNTWTIDWSYTYTYDIDNKMLTKSTGNDWITTYSYDINGNLMTEFNEYLGATNWETNSRINYSYDVNNNMTIILYEQWKNGAWENYYKTLYTYNSNGNILTSTNEYWDNNTWMSYNPSYTYTYDANGKRLTDVYIAGNPASYSELGTYQYDANGNMVERMFEIHDQWNGVQNINKYKYTYAYDSEGHSISGKGERLNNGVWEPVNGNVAFPSGQNKPYSLYYWSDYPWFNFYCDSISNIYRFDASDENSNLTQDSCFSMSISSMNNSGSANVWVSDSTAVYSYLWSNNVTTPWVNNLNSGYYCVTVSGYNGCVKSGCVYVSAIQDTTTVQDSCFSISVSSYNGSASVWVSDSIGVYSYYWSNNAATPTISNLNSGYYCVTVTGYNGCVKSACAYVTGTQDSCFSLQIYTMDNNSLGGKTVNVSINANSYNNVYSYLWSTGDTTNSISGINPGTYCVTVSNQYGCSRSACTYISDTIQLDTCFNLSLYGNSIHDANQNDGMVGAYVSASYNTNDSLEYEFLWNTGQTTQWIDSLAIGLYCVTVTNSLGCVRTACYEVVDSSAYNNNSLSVYIDAQASYSDSSSCTGSAVASVNNNSNSNQFIWSNGQTSQAIYNLCPGYYCVTVIDIYGNQAASCTYIEDYTNYDSTNVVVPTDTVASTLDSCFLNGVIDSAWVSGVYANANGVYAEWHIVQNGVEMIVAISYAIDSAGTYQLNLVINCLNKSLNLMFSDIYTVTDEDLEIQSVFENHKKTLIIMPNPAVDNIQVNYIGNAKYEVINMQGMLVLQGEIRNSEKINISELTSGCYILNLHNEKQSLIGRFVK